MLCLYAGKPLPRLLKQPIQYASQETQLRSRGCCQGYYITLGSYTVGIVPRQPLPISECRSSNVGFNILIAMKRHKYTRPEKIYTTILPESFDIPGNASASGPAASEVKICLTFNVVVILAGLRFNFQPTHLKIFNSILIFIYSHFEEYQGSKH